jgi:hypothetical protein
MDPTEPILDFFRAMSTVRLSWSLGSCPGGRLCEAAALAAPATRQQRCAAPRRDRHPLALQYWLQVAAFQIIGNQVVELYHTFFSDLCRHCRGTGLVTCALVRAAWPTPPPFCLWPARLPACLPVAAPARNLPPFPPARPPARPPAVPRHCHAAR